MAKIYDENCCLCVRLWSYRRRLQEQMPHAFNGPVDSFGDLSARLLIVGLAPGRMGANRTGRPFTGDFAGDLLYTTLGSFGFMEGEYMGRADDGVVLRDCRITNALKCVPPQNKPSASEVKACGSFLSAEIGAMPNLRVILCLGVVSHNAVLRVLGLRLRDFAFAHARVHMFGESRYLLDSYHCSRYNTNTGRLTGPMFDCVFGRVRDLLSV